MLGSTNAYSQTPKLFDSLPGKPNVRVIGSTETQKRIIHLRQIHEDPCSVSGACEKLKIYRSQGELELIYDALVKRGVSRTLLDEGMTEEYMEDGKTSIAEHQLLHNTQKTMARRDDADFLKQYNPFDLRIFHGEVPIAPADSLVPYEMVMQARETGNRREFTRLQKEREDATIAIAAESNNSMLRYGAGHRFDRALNQYTARNPNSKAYIVEITPRSLLGKPCGANINRP